MSTAATASPSQRKPELADQTVVLVGGSAGIGLATARAARAEGAEVVLTGRNRERLEQAAQEVGARGTAAFDAADHEALEGFLADLGEIDHVLVTAGGPHYEPLATMDFDKARRAVEEHLWLPLYLARAAVGKVRASGSLLFMSGTGGRRPTIGLAVGGALTVGSPALIANLALEIAPIRVNAIAAGFVDTPLSASLLGDGLDDRREQLRLGLPIGRVVGPDDVAALAIHLMANTALTGATYDIDGGQLAAGL